MVKRIEGRIALTFGGTGALGRSVAGRFIEEPPGPAIGPGEGWCHQNSTLKPKVGRKGTLSRGRSRPGKAGSSV